MSDPSTWIFGAQTAAASAGPAAATIPVSSTAEVPRDRLKDMFRFT
ncbi:hypothetical protein [Streptomyces sp. G-G2]|nr:hypothetical protein [Streptomyces sp. G-G2]MDJ0385177.1 hypothetical protein [Streptomyces sp. G-G2]